METPAPFKPSLKRKQQDIFREKHKEVKNQPYVPLESVMRGLNPSCLRLVSSRSSAVEPRKMRNARRLHSSGGRRPSRGAQRGGAPELRAGSHWSAPPLIKPPPPPLTGQRMCGRLFRLRAAAAFRSASETWETTAEHT